MCVSFVNGIKANRMVVTNKLWEQKTSLHLLVPPLDKEDPSERWGGWPKCSESDKDGL